jgi:hypothetical protein
MQDASPAEDTPWARPRDLGGGLILRWATPADEAAVTELDWRMYGREKFVRWAGDLRGGQHPTTGASDMTIVLDERAGGKVVSHVVMIGQTWAYDGIPFSVGRPELVVTDPAYRRRGLINAQFAAIHARSAARGEMVQAVTGIPWFYRRYGYAPALDLRGYRRWHWRQVRALPPGGEEGYRLRPATGQDIPLLETLHAIHCASSLISRVRDTAEWRWDLEGPHPASFQRQAVEVIEDGAGRPAGYVVTQVVEDVWTQVTDHAMVLAVHELAAAPGHALHALCEFLGRALRTRVEELNSRRDCPLTSLALFLSPAHPAHAALGDLLEKPVPPYAWYLRIADLAAFLRHIAPSLEQRLAGSVHDGYSGALRLDFYTSRLTLTFERGRLVEVDTPGTPGAREQRAAHFPDATFLQLLFGYRSLADLRYAHAECYADSAGTAVLLETLFPRRASYPAALA